MNVRSINFFIDLSSAVNLKAPDTNSLSDTEIMRILENFPEISSDSLIIVNDHHRSTPTSKIIKLLRELGKICKSVSFMIATGSHPSPDLEIAVKITGAEGCDEIFLHDTNKKLDYSYAGTSSRETEIYYNSAINKYDRLITIGSVEPHYFAGFTGGGKSLVPGLAARQTIAQNHRWAMKSDAIAMETVGNPVFEDIWESANRIRPLKEIHSIQMVNQGRSIFNINAGILSEAFDKAKEYSGRFYGRKVSQKFDRIISIVEPPLDRDLYQAQKALENCRNVLKDNGTIVLVAECGEGIGISDFFGRLSSLGAPQNVLKQLTFENYNLGDHKAHKLAELSQRSELLYLGKLSSEIVSKAYMERIDMETLKELYNKWIMAGNSVLLDEAGGFAVYYL